MLRYHGPEAALRLRGFQPMTRCERCPSTAYTTRVVGQPPKKRLCLQCAVDVELDGQVVKTANGLPKRRKCV